MRLAILIAGAAGLLAVQAHAQPAPDQRALPAISVVGEGTVAVVPDLAVVTNGVVTRATAAGAALKANSEAMEKVLKTLKDAGVADRDVSTSGLTIQPQYDYGDGRDGSRAPKLAGYEVRNTVTVRARDLDRLGGLLDALVTAGSNQMEGLAFDVADRATPTDEARKAAVADARRKAELYAAGAGVKLGAVLSIDERDAVPEQPIRRMAVQAKAADAAVPIARGEQEIDARVAVRWAIER